MCLVASQKKGLFVMCDNCILDPSRPSHCELRNCPAGCAAFRMLFASESGVLQDKDVNCLICLACLCQVVAAGPSVRQFLCCYYQALSFLLEQVSARLEGLRFDYHLCRFSSSPGTCCL
jgi:hypothetical protein